MLNKTTLTLTRNAIMLLSLVERDSSFKTFLQKTLKFYDL